MPLGARRSSRLPLRSGTDNTVKILVDNVEKKSASLLSDTDFKPPVNPPKEIDDPEDKKPEDWIDEPKMDEPGASKPDDWDEEAPTQIPDPKISKPTSWLDDAPDQIPDPSAAVPSDWDADEDGEWEAPLIKNPDCAKYGCGEWKAPLIANPDYKGKWYAPKVDNPEYIGVWAPRNALRLEASAAELAGLHFFGSAHSPRGPTSNDAFQRDECEQKAVHVAKTLPRIDVLVTHARSPAFEAIAQRARVWVHGHFHDQYGITRDDGRIWVNAASCDMIYRPVHPPVVVDLQAETCT